MIEFSFPPNSKRAIALDKRMRYELAQSLEQLNAQLKTQLSNPEFQLFSSKLRSVSSDIKKNRISPAVFAAYYQIIFSIMYEEDIYQEKIDDLVSYTKFNEKLSFNDFSVISLGNNKTVDLYNSCLDTDSNTSFEFLPPSEQQSLETKTSVLKALELMKLTVPNMADEFLSIVNQIVLAAASKKPNARRFDGASSYMLWGALILSVDDKKSDLEMMETLAHESGHSFLFGLTIDEPLTVNDEETLYSSPLREDKRPMDGIYHATFVSARMHYVIDEASKSSILSRDQMLESVKLKAASSKAFFDGYSTVDKEGDLSNTGKQIIQNAYNYMHGLTDN